MHQICLLQSKTVAVAARCRATTIRPAATRAKSSLGVINVVGAVGVRDPIESGGSSRRIVVGGGRSGCRRYTQKQHTNDRNIHCRSAAFIESNNIAASWRWPTASRKAWGSRSACRLASPRQWLSRPMWLESVQSFGICHNSWPKRPIHSAGQRCMLQRRRRKPHSERLRENAMDDVASVVISLRKGTELFDRGHPKPVSFEDTPEHSCSVVSAAP